jgi:hypothetical protein
MRPIYPVLFFFALTATQQAFAGPTPDENQIRQQIVKQSVDAYLATGHPCACPYNLTRSGSRYGARSAYSRPGGASPLCYPSDVTEQMVLDWKHHHASEAPRYGPQ